MVRVEQAPQQKLYSVDDKALLKMAVTDVFNARYEKGPEGYLKYLSQVGDRAAEHISQKAQLVSMRIAENNAELMQVFPDGLRGEIETRLTSLVDKRAKSRRGLVGSLVRHGRIKAEHVGIDGQINVQALSQTEYFERNQHLLEVLEGRQLSEKSRLRERAENANLNAAGVIDLSEKRQAKNQITWRAKLATAGLAAGLALGTLWSGAFSPQEETDSAYACDCDENKKGEDKDRDGKGEDEDERRRRRDEEDFTPTPTPTFTRTPTPRPTFTPTPTPTARPTETLPPTPTSTRQPAPAQLPRAGEGPPSAPQPRPRQEQRVVRQAAPVKQEIAESAIVPSGIPESTFEERIQKLLINLQNRAALDQTAVEVSTQGETVGLVYDANGGSLKGAIEAQIAMSVDPSLKTQAQKDKQGNPAVLDLSDPIVAQKTEQAVFKVHDNPDLQRFFELATEISQRINPQGTLDGDKIQSDTIVLPLPDALARRSGIIFSASQQNTP